MKDRALSSQGLHQDKFRAEVLRVNSTETEMATPLAMPPPAVPPPAMHPPQEINQA